MSLGQFINSKSLETVGWRVPWQFRVRPALFVTVISIVVVLVIIGGLVLTRRLLGAFSAELPPNVMLFLALATAVSVSFARIAWRRCFPLESPDDLSLTDQLVGWGSSIGLALLAVGSFYPGYRTTDWLIWLPILVADQLWRQTFFDAGKPWSPESAWLPQNAGLPELKGGSGLPSAPAISNVGVPQDENILQQLYRLEDEQGLEVIYGTVRADFVVGQRTAVVHVGFCPPLGYLPEIEAEALPGSQAKIKIVQAMAHGTRLDVRLPAPSQTDCQLWIDMAARPVGTLAEVKST